MVKLQSFRNKFFLTVPIEKVKRSKIKKGDQFDIDITSEGNLIFVKIKD